MVWEREKTFHPRQVMLPAEVRDSPSDSLLLLVPGKFNVRLKRFQYYSDPVLSPWARHDPNKPKPVIKEATKPVVAQPAAAPPSSPVAGVDLGEIGKKAGDVASQVLGNFANRFGRKP